VTSGGRTALVVVTPEVEELLAPWRRRFLRTTVERGIPAHITVLFPFVPADEIEGRVEERVRELYAAVAPFTYALASVESFPGYAWLAPRPDAPFLDLMARTHATFPEYPPYGDRDVPAVPHCTVGAADEPEALAEIVTELRSALAADLPVKCRAEAVTLLEEGRDGIWATRATFALSAGR
jgi:2'-5' RNA ligase